MDVVEGAGKNEAYLAEKIVWTNERRLLADLKPWERNPRQISREQAKRLAESFDTFGQVETIAVGPDNQVYNGHQRLSVLMDKHGSGYEVEVRVASRALTEKEREKLTVFLHKGAAGEWDFDALSEWDVPDLVEWGFEPEELGITLDETETDEQEHKSLLDRFIVPPFSVLDARQGYWQARKRAWIDLGIESELGRGECVTCPGDAITEPGLNYYRNRENGKGLARTFGQDIMKGENHNFGVIGGQAVTLDRAARRRLADKQSNLNDSPLTPPWAVSTGTERMAAGTSIFDPVLCELVYRWFSLLGARVLDPFAGGSVRGIVASRLGRDYTGIDLRPEQIEANEKQAVDICTNNKPRWIVGDSRDLHSLLPEEEYDLIFSCPPYFDLELYSDNENDLSNTGDYTAFIEAYNDIVAQAVARLKNNCFACFIVGDIRDKQGFYRNFVSDTIAAFQDAGATLYNEAILVTSVGSLPIRVTKQFQSGRKLGKTHQNVLVFYKGDPRKIKELGEVECGDIEPDIQAVTGNGS